MQSAEIAALVTVIGTFLSFLGVSGIDTGTISTAVTGIISFITIGTALWSWYVHHQNASKQ